MVHQPSCTCQKAVAWSAVMAKWDKLKSISAPLVALAVLAAVASPARAEQPAVRFQNTHFCTGPCGCRALPDPYWEGPHRVSRPYRDWRVCYWHQTWGGKIRARPLPAASPGQVAAKPLAASMPRADAAAAVDSF